MSSVGNGLASRLTVLVTDPDPMTARLLASDLQRQQKFDILECAPTARSIHECIAGSCPAVLVLGLNHRVAPNEWLNLLRNLRTRSPKTRVVVLLERPDREIVSELFRAGIRGIFERSAYDPVHLSRCIECVADGQIWARSELLEFVMNAFANTTPLRVVNATGEDLLTPREMDVVRLVADGFGNREIALQLGLSSHTIKNYLFNIFEKLGVSSRAELILYVLSKNGGAVRTPALSPRIPTKPTPISQGKSNRALAG